MSDFAERVEERESGRRRPPASVIAGGPRFAFLTKVVAVLLVIGIPAAAYVLQKPGSEGESGGINLETGANVWFCVAGSTDRGSNELIDIANPSGRTAAGRYTWFVGDQRLESQQLSVPPGGRVEVDADKELAARPVGQLATAIIELDATSVAVVETVSIDSKEATGTMSAPCTAGTGGTRYFAGGSSVRGANTSLLVSNPFPQDAVIDVDVYTETGIERPNNLQRLPLFAGKSAVLKVSDEVRRRSALGTSIRAESGQVVAQQMVTSNGERIPAGVALSAGSAGPATEWWFTDGIQLTEVAQVVSIMNPSDKEALIEIGFVAEGMDADLGRVQSTRVAPSTETTLTIDPGLPPGTPYSTILRSTNDVGVVADRMIGYSSSISHGMSFAPGATAPSTSFLIPNAWGLAPTSPFTTSLVVANPGNSTARLTIGRLTDGSLSVPDGLRDIPIPGGRRVTIPVSESFPAIRGMSLGVKSDVPVFAETRTTANAPRRGFESQVSHSLPGGFIMPPVTAFVPPTPSPQADLSATGEPTIATPTAQPA